MAENVVWMQGTEHKIAASQARTKARIRGTVRISGG